VRVKGERPWVAGVSLSNGGSSETGRDRLTLIASHGNLWDRDHALDLAYTTSIERSSAVRQVGASYKIPLYSVGGVVSAGLSSSTIKGDFGTFTTNGAGTSMSLGYMQHLGGSGSWRHFVQLRLDDKLSKASAVNGLAIGVDRRSRPITLGYLVKGEASSYPFGFGIDYSVNSPTGAGNDDTAYQLEDPQRPLRARWSKLRMDGNFSMELPARWQLLWRGQAQYASAPLISSEQLIAGGRTWLRGAGSVFGDRGLLSAVDVYSPELAPGLRGLLFFDVASLSNNNGTLARPSSDVLSSAGLGLRYNHTAGWYVVADYAQVLKGSVIALSTNSAAPQRGNSSVYVTVGARF
jgi:hemolysin activation/secretion protein